MPKKVPEIMDQESLWTVKELTLVPMELIIMNITPVIATHIIPVSENLYSFSQWLRSIIFSLDNSSTENSSSNSEGLTDAEIKRFRRHQFTKDEGVCSICMEDYIIAYTG